MTLVHVDQPLYPSTFNRIIKYTLKIQDKMNTYFSLPTNFTTIIVSLQRKASKALLIKCAFEFYLHMCKAFAFVRTVGEEKDQSLTGRCSGYF